jgi:hypothetical protein
MRFRLEAFEKYRTAFDRVRQGPPAMLLFPRPGFGPSSPDTRLRFGPLRVDDNPPIMRLFDRLLAAKPGPHRVLEIGPGSGPLATYALRTHGPKIATWEGIERDPHVRGPYRRVEDIAGASDDIDLAVAIEVIEHMPAQAFYESFLARLMEKLAPGASFMISTPNALAAGRYHTDFTHVQHYPWYDLYALLRLFFEEVDMYRTYYPHVPIKWALLPLRQLNCAALGLDWCDGLVAVASKPRLS